MILSLDSQYYCPVLLRKQVPMSLTSRRPSLLIIPHFSSSFTTYDGMLARWETREPTIYGSSEPRRHWATCSLMQATRPQVVVRSGVDTSTKPGIDRPDVGGPLAFGQVHS